MSLVHQLFCNKETGQKGDKKQVAFAMIELPVLNTVHLNCRWPCLTTSCEKLERWCPGGFCSEVSFFTIKTNQQALVWDSSELWLLRSSYLRILIVVHALKLPSHPAPGNFTNTRGKPQQSGDLCVKVTWNRCWFILKDLEITVLNHHKDACSSLCGNELNLSNLSQANFYRSHQGYCIDKVHSVHHRMKLMQAD